MTTEKLRQYHGEVQQELNNILDWWATHMPDKEGEGFYGSIHANGIIDYDAARGLVMYSRILWTFSAAFRKEANPRWLQIAEVAFNYITRYFNDEECGGMYWSVDRNGNVLENKKQVYGLAFAIYGLSEFHIATGNGNAMMMAIDVYKLIEQHNETTTAGGYLEAFTRDWKPLTDLRLSEKDANEKKSMNTHLHVLEAYTNLYRTWKNEQLAKAIRKLLEIFDKHIIDTKSFTQQLFFNEAWESKSQIVSYGHDIEASWLLYEAAEVLEDKELIEHWKEIAVKMAHISQKGLDADGGMWYEKEQDLLIKEKHWWPQAEAMVGYLNAYQLSNEMKYLDLSFNSFSFIKNNLLDKQEGEWHWGIYEDGSPMQKEKAGFWKCPYHNGRACMEVSHRLQQIITTVLPVTE
jgi:cellobiose epimerase